MLMQTITSRLSAALSLVILLVDDPAKSACFYRDLFGLEPVEQSPTFAMFALPSGIAVGLWSRRTVEPPMAGGPGATELCFMEADVDEMHEAWASRGVAIAQAPTDLDFGRTFVALDPDGHRLRVFRPAEEPAAHA
jgi:predicted enzyme related to lactoylglutathione lyase